jgi:hypothetical protein
MLKNKIMFYIIVTLNIILMLFLYLGFFRYICLYFIPLDYYINNYTKKKNKNIGKTIISIESNKENIKKLEPVLKSLLDQSVRIDGIYINVHDKFEIPDFIKKIAIVNVTGKDYGDRQNFLPMLLREESSDTNIICLSNTMIYDYNLIEDLTSEVDKDQYKIICIDDKDFKKGMLIKPKFFDSDIMLNKNIDINQCINNNIKKTGFKTLKIKNKCNYNII